MSIYSSQKLFCNVCGKEMFGAIPNMMGRGCKVCSMECVREFHWREILSILNKAYYPDPRSEEIKTLGSPVDTIQTDFVKGGA